MKRTLIAVSVLSVLLALLFFINESLPPRSGFVEAVIDGDTVRLKSGGTIRYLGLNTAETNIRKDEAWFQKESYWAKKAKAFNEELVLNEKIRLEYDKIKKDKYGRLLAYVFKDSTFINEAILKNGLAVIDVRYPNVKYADLLALSFKDAKSKKIGIHKTADLFDFGDLSNLEGDIVNISGSVLDFYIGKEVIIIFMPSSFKLVIFKNNLSIFKDFDLKSLKNKKVRVCGMIKKYKNNYEIIVHHPYQMEVLE